MQEDDVSAIAPGNVMRKVPGIGVATLRAIKSAPSAYVVPCKNEESKMFVPVAVATDSTMPLSELMNGQEENGGGKGSGINNLLAEAAAAEASTGGSIIMPLIVGDPKQPNRIAKQKTAKVRVI